VSGLDMGEDGRMRLSARVDYALRAMAELAAAPVDSRNTVDGLATAQSIPAKYLEAILGSLRRAGLLRSQRGPEGGYRLARPATEISIADIIRAIDGPLATFRGERPEDLTYPGAAAPLQEVWIALRASERAILDEVTLAHIATNKMPRRVRTLIADRAAWD
jgi:Rrf2 family protein